MAATDHATPMPRNTLTALLPVTLPMDASACWSCMAATLLAKDPGSAPESADRAGGGTLTHTCGFRALLIFSLGGTRAHPRSPGMEVPSATNTTAVTVSRRPTVQPKCDARSPMKAVRRPMELMETRKQAQPFQYSVGGTQANRTFQKTVTKCMT
ncbi:hypothetical protein EYF80_012980 [Liparis tanakae]|uniref:Uncharacterized protein n=1 Tax=Liparis tanakae TaxID=230148 RepID=A0A4Z2IG31_9TELE|nr:hypothetical protein EYF80_012980 [Liparis tanakae]